VGVSGVFYKKGVWAVIKLFKSLIEPAQNYLSENDNLIAPAAVHGFLAATSNTPL